MVELGGCRASGMFSDLRRETRVHYRVPCIFIIEGRGGEGRGFCLFWLCRFPLCITVLVRYWFGFSHLVVVFDRMRAGGGRRARCINDTPILYHITLLLGQSIFLPPRETSFVSEFYRLDCIGLD